MHVSMHDRLRCLRRVRTEHRYNVQNVSPNTLIILQILKYVFISMVVQARKLNFEKGQKGSKIAKKCHF